MVRCAYVLNTTKECAMFTFHLNCFWISKIFNNIQGTQSVPVYNMNNVPFISFVVEITKSKVIIATLCLYRSCHNIQLGINSSRLSHDSPDSIGLKNSVPASRKILFGTPNTAEFFIAQEHDISDNACEYFNFPTVGANTYSSRISINPPLTGSSRARRGV